MWHTFATHGICPRCSKVWHDTQCPRCKLWSPIDDWYREDFPIQQPPVRREQPETQEELSAGILSLTGEDVGGAAVPYGDDIRVG